MTGLRDKDNETGQRRQDKGARQDKTKTKIKR